ncbi:MAG: DUF4340 domain-containing protein [Gammaproteobacteria bacterium]
MSARALINLGLAILVAALAAVAILRPGRHAAPEAPPLTAIAADAVQSIVVDRPGQPQARLERDGAAWRLRAPYQGPAEQTRVQALLDLARERASTPIQAGGGELARFGLAPPKATVHLGSATIEIGDSHPLDGRRYVRTGGQVRLVTDNAYPLLVANAAEFLDTALVDRGETLAAVHLPQHVLQREAQRWTDRGPGTALAEGAVKDIVQAWRDARALQVAARADEAPIEVIELRFDSGRGVHFEVIRTAPDLVLAHAGRDVQYVVDSHTAARLLGGTLPGMPAPAPQAPAPAPAPAPAAH